MPFDSIPPPTLTDAPAVPDRSDRTTFSARAIAQDTFVKLTEIPQRRLALANVASNAGISFTNANEASASATAANTSAVNALASATAAAASAGAVPWVSGTTYTAGTRQIDPVDGRIYRRLITGAGTTAPRLDATNYAPVQTGLVLQVVTGTTQAVMAGFRYATGNVAATVFTAPATAAPGDEFEIAVTNNLRTNSINWAGLKHEGITDTTTAIDLVGSYNFVYINPSFGWKASQ